MSITDLDLFTIRNILRMLPEREAIKLATVNSQFAGVVNDIGIYQKFVINNNGSDIIGGDFAALATEDDIKKMVADINGGKYRWIRLDEIRVRLARYYNQITDESIRFTLIPYVQLTGSDYAKELKIIESTIRETDQKDYQTDYDEMTLQEFSEYQNNLFAQARPDSLRVNPTPEEISNITNPETIAKYYLNGHIHELKASRRDNTEPVFGFGYYADQLSRKVFEDHNPNAYDPNLGVGSPTHMNVLTERLHYEYNPYYFQIDFGVGTANESSRRFGLNYTTYNHGSIDKMVQLVRNWSTIDFNQNIFLSSSVWSALLQKPDFLFELVGTDPFFIESIPIPIIYKFYGPIDLSVNHNQVDSYGRFKLTKLSSDYRPDSDKSSSGYALESLEKDRKSKENIKLLEITAEIIINSFEEFGDSLFPIIDVLDKPISSDFLNSAIKIADYQRIHMILNNQYGPRGNKRFETEIDPENIFLIQNHPGLSKLLGLDIQT